MKIIISLTYAESTGRPTLLYFTSWKQSSYESKQNTFRVDLHPASGEVCTNYDNTHFVHFSLHACSWNKRCGTEREWWLMTTANHCVERASRGRILWKWVIKFTAQYQAFPFVQTLREFLQWWKFYDSVNYRVWKTIDM